MSIRDSIADCVESLVGRIGGGVIVSGRAVTRAGYTAALLIRDGGRKYIDEHGRLCTKFVTDRNGREHATVDGVVYRLVSAGRFGAYSLPVNPRSPSALPDTREQVIDDLRRAIESQVGLSSDGLLEVEGFESPDAIRDLVAGLLPNGIDDETDTARLRYACNIIESVGYPVMSEAIAEASEIVSGIRAK